MRTLPIEAILEALSAERYASFVVAALSPSRRLWKIKNGQLEEQTHIGRSWSGDPEANELFTRNYHEPPGGPDGDEVQFRLFAAMQRLLSMGELETIGGYLTRVSTTQDGFRFALDSSGVGPDLVHGVLQSTPEGSSLALRTDPGVASTGYDVLLAAESHRQ